MENRLIYVSYNYNCFINENKIILSYVFYSSYMIYVTHDSVYRCYV